MRIVRSLCVLAAAAGLVFTMSTSASAGSYSLQTNDGHPGGKVTFDTYGDIVVECRARVRG